MNRPVGRIDYLDMKGRVAEQCYYYTEKEFLDRVMEANYYGANMVVNVFRDASGKTIPLDFVTDFDPPPAGFKILDYEKGDSMNESQQIRELVRRFKEMYKPGTRVELERMGDDPRPIPPGTRGTVRVVDDMGTVHCDFDNGRRMGLVPGVDRFRQLTQAEVLEEQCEIRQQLFIDKVNEEVIPCIEWVGMKTAYRSGDMEVPTELLSMLHAKFLEVYGTDHIEPSDGFLTVPGVVQAADGKLYPALLDVDAASSGEHYGTTFFTPKGVLCDQAGIPEVKEEIKKLIPYNYWYTVHMERDHHVDWNYCPNEAIDMLEEAVDRCQTEGINQQ